MMSPFCPTVAWRWRGDRTAGRRPGVSCKPSLSDEGDGRYREACPLVLNSTARGAAITGGVTISVR